MGRPLAYGGDVAPDFAELQSAASLTRLVQILVDTQDSHVGWMVSGIAWLLPGCVELDGLGSFEYWRGSIALIYCELVCFLVSQRKRASILDC